MTPSEVTVAGTRREEICIRVVRCDYRERRAMGNMCSATLCPATKVPPEPVVFQIQTPRNNDVDVVRQYRPSCPICLDEFVAGKEVYKLSCQNGCGQRIVCGICWLSFKTMYGQVCHECRKPGVAEVQKTLKGGPEVLSSVGVAQGDSKRDPFTDITISVAPRQRQQSSNGRARGSLVC